MQKADYRQTRLLKKTTEGNLGLERSGLTEEEDLEGIKKEARLEREAEKPKREAEREIGKEAGPKQEVEKEERTEQWDFILSQASKITY